MRQTTLQLRQTANDEPYTCRPDEDVINAIFHTQSSIISMQYAAISHVEVHEAVSTVVFQS